MLTILAVMVGTGIHEIFEGPDATPFLLDPDFLLIALGAVLILCLGRALIAFQRVLLAVLLVVIRTLQLGDCARSHWSVVSSEKPLFAPPRRLLPLRI